MVGQRLEQEKVDFLGAARALSQPTADYQVERANEALPAIWTCRILLSSRRLQVLLSSGMLQANSVRELLGCEPGSNQIPRQRIVARARRELRALERKCPRPPSPIGENVKRLARLARLSKVEQDVLVFIT